MKNKPSISVVIPVFNESQSLQELNQLLERTLKGYDYELIYINDGSTDGSFDILKKIKKDNKRIKAVFFKTNRGKSFAYSEGFKVAKKELIATIDSDLQIDPSDILPMVSKLLEGYDVVVGWRKKRADSLFRVRIPSWTYNFTLRYLFNVKVHDSVCPLKVFKSTCLKVVILQKGEHRLLIPLLKNKGYKIRETEIPHKPRRYGKSKFTFVGRMFETLIPLFRMIFKSNVR